MITITTQGKTYKPTPTFNDFISKIVYSSITEWGLEEVKENKELETPQFTPWQEEPTYMESMWWKATPEWNILVPQFTPWQKIELVPEYELKTQDNGRHRIVPSHEEKQIILLTERLNQVITKLNK